MKKIGLLGGTSYPSTMLYYKRLNELYNQARGGFHSCPLILYNIDYHYIKTNYKNGWAKVPGLLRNEILELLKLRPDSLLICNNTLHKAFDEIRDTLDLQIPVVHIIDLTAAYLLNQGLDKVLLLGTRFTMEDDFFKTPLIKNDIEVGIPNAQERGEIQKIQTAVSKGLMKDGFHKYFQQLANKYENEYQAVILACTELPMVFEHVDTTMNLIDTIELQCNEAMKLFAHA